MHPRECFRFSEEEYQAKIETRETNQLLRDARCKRAKVIEVEKRIDVEILLTILSHGSLFWMVMLSYRSKSVSKDKLAIINNELRTRQGLSHIHRRPFDMTKIDISLEVLHVLGTMDKRQNQSNQSTTVPPPESVNSQTYDAPVVEYDLPPPPYEAKESKAA